MSSDALAQIKEELTELARLRETEEMRDALEQWEDALARAEAAESALADAKAEGVRLRSASERALKHETARRETSADLEEVVGRWRADAAARDARLARCQDALREALGLIANTPILVLNVKLAHARGEAEAVDYAKLVVEWTPQARAVKAAIRAALGEAPAPDGEA